MNTGNAELTEQPLSKEGALYRNIVVGVDASEQSKAALIETSNWLRRHGGRLTLVHAVYFDEEEFSLAPEQRDMRLELGKKICSAAGGLTMSEFGIKADSLVREGEPHEVIVNVARERGADLITMGTYGRKGLRRLLMGSVASGVIVDAPCDVLVVKKPCTECTGVYSSILVPFDGSEYSRKALSRACHLAATGNADVVVLYVIPRYEEMIGFFMTDSITKRLTEEAEKILDVARKTAAEDGVTPKTVIRHGQAGEEIISTSLALKNDLIVMGTYGWRGMDKAIMGSTTGRVIMNASCPVLAVR